MDQFDTIMDFIFRPDIEGGYSNDPNDPGGETNFGISRKYNPGVDIKGLTRPLAKAIYQQGQWRAINGSMLPAGLNLLVMDAAVNQGIPEAVMMLQTSLGIQADGIMGYLTLGAMGSSRPIDLMNAYTVQRMLRYQLGKNFPRYGQGWINRLAAAYKTALGLLEIGKR